MEVVEAIVGVLTFLSGPAAIVGGITALVARSAGRSPVRAFWIAFTITVAVEIVLVGTCLALVAGSFD